MKYAIYMSSDAMIYLPSFVKIDSSMQKLIGRIHRYADSIEISLVYLYFSKQEK
jgi:hypothetical protein